jgi:arylsulfatase A-like enzyme
MLHDGRFKYTRYLSADCIEELYDLATDPAELINLAVDPACHDTLKSYRDQATKAFLRKGATFVDKVPPPRVIP